MFHSSNPLLRIGTAGIVMGWTIYCIWAGEFRMRGGWLVRRDKEPVRFWIWAVLCLCGGITLGGGTILFMSGLLP